MTTCQPLEEFARLRRFRGLLHDSNMTPRKATTPQPAGETTDPARTAEEALRRIVRGLRVASRQIEDGASVSAAQLFVLQQIAESPRMSVREIADRTMTDRTSVAHLLERLERDGLVARRRSDQDRRRYEIVLEPKGEALLAKAPLSPTAQVLRAMHQLSPSELAALTRGLQLLVKAMGLTGGTLPLLFADTPEGARAPSGRITFTVDPASDE